MSILALYKHDICNRRLKLKTIIMRKITLLLAALMVVALAQPAAANTIYDNDERQIEFKELPDKAQQFIKKHFAKEELSLVLLDTGLVSNEYEVVLANGTKIEFKGDGEWKDIDCRGGEVPAALVPKKIADYVTKKYSSATITELKREHREWEVKLSNGLELTFDNAYRLTEIDD